MNYGYGASAGGDHVRRIQEVKSEVSGRTTSAATGAYPVAKPQIESMQQMAKEKTMAHQLAMKMSFAMPALGISSMVDSTMSISK